MIEDRVAALLDEAAPEPPRDIDLAAVAARVRRRRRWAIAASAVGIVVVTAAVLVPLTVLARGPARTAAPPHPSTGISRPAPGTHVAGGSDRVSYTVLDPRVVRPRFTESQARAALTRSHPAGQATPTTFALARITTNGVGWNDNRPGTTRIGWIAVYTKFQPLLPNGPAPMPHVGDCRLYIVLDATSGQQILSLQVCSPPRARTPVAGNPQNLVGIDWQLHTVGGQPAQTHAGSFGFGIEPNGRFGQNIGSCDSLGGQLSITGTHLNIHQAQVSFGLCPSLVGLSPREQQQVTALKHMFTGSVSWSIQHGQLTLRKAGVPTIVYTRSPGSPVQTRQWTFHGVGITVPASWRKNATRCGTPIANTVILPGVVSTCSYHPRPPGISSVQFTAYDPSYDPFPSPPPGEPTTTSIDGTAARVRTTGPRASLQIVEVQIRSRNVTVTIISPNRNEAVRLMSELYTTGH